MTPDLGNYRLEGDNSAYRLPSGLVAPFVTKGGQEDGVTRTRPLVWVTTRTPENIVVNLPDVDDSDLRDWLDR